MYETRRFFAVLIPVYFWSPSRHAPDHQRKSCLWEQSEVRVVLREVRISDFVRGFFAFRYRSRDWESSLRFSSVPSLKLVHTAITEFRSQRILFIFLSNSNLRIIMHFDVLWYQLLKVYLTKSNTKRGKCWYYTGWFFRY